MDNNRTAGGWAEGLDFVPDPAAKETRARRAVRHLHQPAEGPGHEGRRARHHRGQALGSVGVGRSTAAGSSTASPRPARSTSGGATRACVAAAHAALDHLDNGNFLLCSTAEGRARGQARRDHSGRAVAAPCSARGGGEAIDFAIKLARGATGRPRIVSTVNGYHGHTGFALSAAGRAAFRQPFEPLMPEFVQVPFGDLERPRGRRRRAHRRRAARADPGRGRDRGAAAGLPGRGARRLRPRRRAADPRRDPDRARPHRALVGERTRRRGPRHHDDRQVPRRLARADLGHRVHRGAARVPDPQPVHPPVHLRRFGPRVRGRARGDRGDRGDRPRRATPPPWASGSSPACDAIARRASAR